MCNNELIGITSWGNGNDCSERLAVFTKVEAYQSWINRTLSKINPVSVASGLKDYVSESHTKIKSWINLILKKSPFSNRHIDNFD